MNAEKLAKRTAQRISNLTEVEFEFSAGELKNHPLYYDGLLTEVRSQESFDKIGRALMLALYVINEADIELHEVSDEQV